MPDRTIVAPEQSSVLGEHPVNSLVTHVARYLGDGEDPDIRELALHALDRAAQRINMVVPCVFRRKEATFSSLTNGQSTLSVSATVSDWAWPQKGIQILDSDDNFIAPGAWLPYDKWATFTSDYTTTGVPLYFTILNPFDDEIRIWPTVDTGSVSKIIIPYMARLQRPSDTDFAYFTEEAREALLTGGVFFLMQQRYTRNPQLWQAYEQDFNWARRALRQAAARHAGDRRLSAHPGMGRRIPRSGDLVQYPIPNEGWYLKI